VVETRNLKLALAEVTAEVLQKARHQVVVVACFLFL
jgi:hypothetical protein